MALQNSKQCESKRKKCIQHFAQKRQYAKKERKEETIYVTRCDWNDGIESIFVHISGTIFKVSRTNSVLLVPLSFVASFTRATHVLFCCLLHCYMNMVLRLLFVRRANTFRLNMFAIAECTKLYTYVQKLWWWVRMWLQFERRERDRMHNDWMIWYRDRCFYIQHNTHGECIRNSMHFVNIYMCSHGLANIKP